jgi:hypothetical protein
MSQNTCENHDQHLCKLYGAAPRKTHPTNMPIWSAIRSLSAKAAGALRPIKKTCAIRHHWAFGKNNS